MDLSKIKAVLFDLDGTLLDTIPDIGTCIQRAFTAYGMPCLPDPRGYAFAVGGGIKNAFHIAAPKDAPEETIMAALDMYLREYPENCTVYTRHFPGVDEMLAMLQGKGLRLGIISNKTEKTAQKIVNHYFSHIPFELVWGNNKVRPLKPTPDVGYLAAQELGLKPDEIIYVGDADTDIIFSHNAGFIGMDIAWGYRSREVIMSAKPDAVFDNALELGKFICENM